MKLLFLPVAAWLLSFDFLPAELSGGLEPLPLESKGV